MDLIQVEHNICKDHKGYTFMYVLRQGNPVGLVSAMSTYIYTKRSNVTQQERERMENGNASASLLTLLRPLFHPQYSKIWKMCISLHNLLRP